MDKIWKGVVGIFIFLSLPQRGYIPFFPPDNW